MSTVTTCSKAKSTDKRYLTDSEMVKEVYATDTTKTSEPTTSSDRPNKIRNIEKEDDPNAMVIEPTETITPLNINEQSREEENGSTNEPMETDKEIISNLEDHQNTTNPQKEFSQEDTYLKYANKKHILLKASIFPYDSANIETYIQRVVEQQAKNSVKITDVPIFYETDALLKNIINVTGKQIKNFHSNEQKLLQNYDFEIKCHRLNNSGRRNNRYSPKPLQYKTVYIKFTNETGAKYHLEKGWSLNIEDFNIKILPSNNNHELYQSRTSHGYKITGLPNNANVKDMDKIVILINRKTCSIPKARNRFCSKTAYIMVEEKDFKDKIMKLTAFNTTLYIIPLKDNIKTCTQCGSPEHILQHCNAEHTLGQNGFKLPPQENNRGYLKEIIDTSSPVTTPIVDNNALQDIVKLKEQMRQAELHIKDLKNQLLSQRKEIENFKQFIKETSAHNEYMSSSMEKMYNLQQNMAHNDSIKDSQMTEILMELKGINRNNNQNVHTQCNDQEYG
ncbi:unnamed protein product [Rhizophagus irregularis]|nr:unnamed protein product [Rhizophagus irregularis]